jgi:2-C-methyl-D-erythritol 4-phosphate cytidylyltransferase
MKLAEIIRNNKRPYCSAVIVAAGSSTRMGEDKLMLPLHGVSVLARSILAFEASSAIDEIVVVTRSEKIVDVARLCESCGVKKVTKILVGGESRTVSVLAGLSESSPKAKVVAIHDGARPLVTEEIIRSVVHQASLFKAAAPGVRLKDTVKRVSDGVVVETPDRDGLVAIQTPQAFWPDLIKGALTDAVQKGVSYTDDCAAVEALGVQVHITAGSYDNLKITTPEDIAAAEGVLERRGE